MNAHPEAVLAGIILGLWLIAMPGRILVKLLRGWKLGPCLRRFFLDLIFTGPVVAIICYFSWRNL